jgi:hypothetical protein
MDSGQRLPVEELQQIPSIIESMEVLGFRLGNGATQPVAPLIGGIAGSLFLESGRDGSPNATGSSESV